MYAAPEELANRGRPHQCRVCRKWVNYYPMGIMLIGQGMCDECFSTCYDEATSYGAWAPGEARQQWERRFNAARRRIEKAAVAAP